jgi:hypothetical protein
MFPSKKFLREKYSSALKIEFSMKTDHSSNKNFRGIVVGVHNVFCKPFKFSGSEKFKTALKNH